MVFAGRRDRFHKIDTDYRITHPGGSSIAPNHATLRTNEADDECYEKEISMFAIELWFV